MISVHVNLEQTDALAEGQYVKFQTRPFYSGTPWLLSALRSFWLII
jgi:hypothetical protein